MDQWGVGRAGVDDGLVILFDLHENDPCHGQVQLYAGPGFRETWLSNEDRQRDLRERHAAALRQCDMDGALLVAMDKIAGVPGARRPQRHPRAGRWRRSSCSAVVGFALYRWWRSGKDPVYLDDPSILMPAPPPGLTPAAGAAVRDGKVTRRALTAASLDLAARGRIAFRAVPSEALFGGDPDLGIYTRDSRPEDPVEQARLERVRRRPMDDATEFLLSSACAASVAATGTSSPTTSSSSARTWATSTRAWRQHLVAQGWFREAPSKVTGRWSCSGDPACSSAAIARHRRRASTSRRAASCSSGVALIVAAVCLFDRRGASCRRGRRTGR